MSFETAQDAADYLIAYFLRRPPHERRLHLAECGGEHDVPPCPVCVALRAVTA